MLYKNILKKGMLAFCMLSGLLFLSGCGNGNEKEEAASENSEDGGPEGETPGFSLDILRTGKSDCIVMIMDGVVIVNDTADADDQWLIQAELEERGITKVDYLILSHFDNDHMGNAAYLVDNYEVDYLIKPDYIRESDHVEALEEALLDAPGTEVLILNEDYEIDTKYGRILINPPSKAYEEDNNNSLITEVEYDGFKMLLTGDALKERLQEYLSKPRGEFEFIKLPHHGDCNKGVKRLINDCRPDYTAVTVEDSSDIEKQLIKALDKVGAELYDSSRGAIHIEIDLEFEIWQD